MVEDLRAFVRELETRPNRIQIVPLEMFNSLRWEVTQDTSNCPKEAVMAGFDNGLSVSPVDRASLEFGKMFSALNPGSPYLRIFYKNGACSTLQLGEIKTEMNIYHGSRDTLLKDMSMDGNSLKWYDEKSGRIQTVCNKKGLVIASDDRRELPTPVIFNQSGEITVLSINKEQLNDVKDRLNKEHKEVSYGSAAKTQEVRSNGQGSSTRGSGRSDNSGRSTYRSDGDWEVKVGQVVDWQAVIQESQRKLKEITSGNKGKLTKRQMKDLRQQIHFAQAKLKKGH